MTMKKISYMLFICAALLITSCASTSRTGVISPFAYTEVHPNEIRADIDISENNKVTGKSKQWYVFGIRVSGGNKYFEDKSEKRSMFGKRTNKAQSCAMYDTLEKSEYDMIVNPQYKNVVHKWFFGLVKRYDVTVTGYGGKINKLYQHNEPTPYQTIKD